MDSNNLNDEMENKQEENEKVEDGEAVIEENAESESDTKQDEDMDLSSFWAEEENLGDWDGDRGENNEVEDENLPEEDEEDEAIEGYREMSLEDDIENEESVAEDLFVEDVAKEKEEKGKKAKKEKKEKKDKKPSAIAKIPGMIIGIIVGVLAGIKKALSSKIKSGGRKLPISKKGLLIIAVATILAAVVAIVVVPKFLAGAHKAAEESATQTEEQHKTEQGSTEEEKEPETGEDMEGDKEEAVEVSKKTKIAGTWVSRDEKTVIHLMNDGTFQKKSSVVREEGNKPPAVEKDLKEGEKRDTAINSDINNLPSLGGYKILGNDYIQFSDNERVYRMTLKTEGENIFIGGMAYSIHDDIAFERFVVIPNFYKMDGKYKLFPHHYILGVIKNSDAKWNDLGAYGYVEISDISGKSRIFIGNMKNGMIHGKGTFYANNQPVYTSKFTMNADK